VVIAFDFSLENGNCGSVPASEVSSATLGKLFTHIASVTTQYNLVLVEGW